MAQLFEDCAGVIKTKLVLAREMFFHHGRNRKFIRQDVSNRTCGKIVREEIQSVWKVLGMVSSNITAFTPTTDSSLSIICLLLKSMIVIR